MLDKPTRHICLGIATGFIQNMLSAKIVYPCKRVLLMKIRLPWLRKPHNGNFTFSYFLIVSNCPWSISWKKLGQVNQTIYFWQRHGLFVNPFISAVLIGITVIVLAIMMASAGKSVFAMATTTFGMSNTVYGTHCLLIELIVHICLYIYIGIVIFK